MIKNIIFDFDGVLVDSEVLLAKSLSNYLANKNIDFSEEEVSKLAGRKTINIISDLSKKFNIQNEQLFFDEVMSLTHDLYNNHLEAVIGVNDFLNKIEQNKLIGSNNLKNRIIYGLQKVKLDKFFNQNAIFTFDTVGVPKPNPDIYLKAVEDSGLIKNETVVIEDSAIGVESANRAGIKVIGLKAGGHWYKNRSDQELYDAGAYVVVNNYEDVLLSINKL